MISSPLPLYRLFTAFLPLTLALGLAVSPGYAWRIGKFAKSGANNTQANLANTREDSAATYVAGVFDRLQSYWEQQAYDQHLDGNVPLTLVLDENGAAQVRHPGGASEATVTESARRAAEFIRTSGAFGSFPASLAGSRLECAIRLTPDSLHLLSYQIVEKQKAEPVISYAGPSVAQPVSLFYARALPVTPGIVQDQPDARRDDETEMRQYVTQVQEQIRKNWRLADDYRFSRTVAVLMIDRDGALLSAQIKRSSGDKVVDKAALNAIYTAGSFPPVPSGVQSLPVTIEYIFEPMFIEEG